jgi:hypothetical protein
MVPDGADGVWLGETPEAVLLDGRLVRENIEKRHTDISALFHDGEKISRLAKALENGMKDLDMPIYNLTGRGHFDDLDIEQGRHRTFMLIASYGVDFLPVLVPCSLAQKFRRLFGYRNGYLTQTQHYEVRALKVIGSHEGWHIGTDLERESVEIFGSKHAAETALNAGDWNQLLPPDQTG